MSRKGNKRILINNGVVVKQSGCSVTVTGLKGSLSLDLKSDFNVLIDNGYAKIVHNSRERNAAAFHGLYQSLISNMVEGVSKGFKIELELTGVGYRVQKDGLGLKLYLGHSHDLLVKPIDGVDLSTDGQNIVVLTGIDKQKVGQAASNIIKLRDSKKDPYKGKGVKFRGQVLRKKSGKKVK